MSSLIASRGTWQISTASNCRRNLNYLTGSRQEAREPTWTRTSTLQNSCEKQGSTSARTISQTVPISTSSLLIERMHDRYQISRRHLPRHFTGKVYLKHFPTEFDSSHAYFTCLMLICTLNRTSSNRYQYLHIPNEPFSPTIHGSIPLWYHTDLVLTLHTLPSVYGKRTSGLVSRRQKFLSKYGTTSRFQQDKFNMHVNHSRLTDFQKIAILTRLPSLP